MRHLIFASAVLAATALCSASLSAQTLNMAPGTLSLADASAPTKIPKKPLIFDLNAIDKTADPCVDFYQYVCGGWNKANPIPGDQARWGRFNELADYNNYSLYSDLKAAADAPKSPLQKKYGDFFASCMNTELSDKLGAKPIQPQLDAIAALSSTKNYAALHLKLEKMSVNLQRGGGGLFGIGVEQDQKDSSQQILGTGEGGITLPDRDYYLGTDDRSKKIVEQYTAHVTRMFVLLGDSPEKAAAETASVLRIETAIAKGTMSRVDMRDPDKTYHVLTIAQLQTISPNYNWKQYLAGNNFSGVPSIDVESPDFVKTVNNILGSEDLAAFKSYLRWHVLHGAAPGLSKSFDDENFAFFGTTLSGQKEQQARWKRCTRITDGALGEAVGQDWVKQNFPPAAKDNMEQLVHALETAMAEDLTTLPWMSDATKVEARKKLDAIRDKIGYPATWRDYSKLTVNRDDLVGNLEHSANFERARDFAKYGKPVDETEWGMTPPTVNAYYDPPMNDINFPAGILQPPFYSEAADPAVNFGAIGVVIGHEMTHGFDDEGSKYDLHGNVRQWWTDEDKKKFDERTECTAKEYDGFTVAPGQNLNGHLTLGENTADNGGLRIAYRALMDTIAKEGAAAEPGYVNGERDGYTPAQRFFISFGQVWCTNQTEQSARVLAKTDPHSSGEFRVKGTVQNFDEFGKAFGCKVGQPMMPASGGCRTW